MKPAAPLTMALRMTGMSSVPETMTAGIAGYCPRKTPARKNHARPAYSNQSRIRSTYGIVIQRLLQAVDAIRLYQINGTHCLANGLCPAAEKRMIICNDNLCHVLPTVFLISGVRSQQSTLSLYSGRLFLLGR